MISWLSRALIGLSIVAYLAHVYLVIRRVREAGMLMLGPTGRRNKRRRHRVEVRAEVLLHEGDGFLLRDSSHPVNG